MLAAPSDAVCISEEAAGSLVDVVLKRAAVARFLKTAAQSNMYSVKIAEPRSFREALLKNSKSVPCPDSLILDLCVADDLPVDAILPPVVVFFTGPPPASTGAPPVNRKIIVKRLQGAQNHVCSKVVLKLLASFQPHYSTTIKSRRYGNNESPV